MSILRPLGINGLYPTYKSPTSGYLFKSESATVLLDLGSGVLSALSSLMPPEKVDCIILTHLHHDHASDLGVLSYYLQSVGKKIRLYAPSDVEGKNQWISSCPYFDFHEIKDGLKVSINGLSVNFYLMNHPVECYGVRIFDGKRTLSYTGDTNLCDNLDDLLNGCDLALMDSAFTFNEWSDSRPHLSATHCALYGKKYGFRLLLTHLNPSKDKNQILSEALKVYSNVGLALYEDYEV